HGIHVAVLPVPVHPISICNSGECEAVHGGQWQQCSGRCPGESSECTTPTRECLVLSAAVPGLGGGCWGRGWGPCECVTSPENPTVSVHLHSLGVLPPTGQEVYHVPLNAAYTGRPPAASIGRQFRAFECSFSINAKYVHFVNARYTSVMTRQRALCVVLLCWVVSVLSSFAQFISSDVLDIWRSGGTGPGTAGLGLHGNWTTSLPHLTPSPPPRYHQDREVIGKYLPYGGFLSKFYVEDMHNFTYAEIHRSHWGVCAPDAILSPQFQVYVHGMTVFMLPLLCLLAIYLDVLCRRPRKTPFSHADPPKHDSCRVRSLALSLSLLVLLCLPLHIIHALLLFAPNTDLPAWVHAVALFLFHLYGLVPQILFTPPKKQKGGGRPSFPLSVPHCAPAAALSRGKSVRMALCEAVQAAPWSSAKHSLKAKVCPEL
ncbi:hypothetical protein L3Q82_013400, partial [Scortum barcoo]